MKSIAARTTFSIGLLADLTARFTLRQEPGAAHGSSYRDDA
jgi:hypothetical protein